VLFCERRTAEGNWIKKTDIPAHKIGKLWKFKRSELDEWIKSGRSAID
jgi:excisionase family DNA binding protein